MPHGARKKSASGYYHVVPKGMRDQVIFESDEDRSQYVRLLAEATKAYEVHVHAYCLMSNHVHLVLEDAKGQLSDFMKYIDERYASYFAQKIGAVGGILRKPFWSEPIENDAYLLCAVRYVHANPAAAGICKASAYRWSSVRDYLGRQGLTYTRTVLDMLGGRDGFIRFSRSECATAHAFPGSALGNHLTDDEARHIAKDVLGTDVHQLAGMSLERQTKAVLKLKERGFSIAQIARISGIGRRRLEWFISNK